MKIRPRQAILDVWQAAARASMSGNAWNWGGRGGRNSIIDAEQLLCILAPAAALPEFILDRPDEMADDVAGALAPFGDPIEIPIRLTAIAEEYLRSYLSPDGQPVFGGGSYFAARSDQEPTADQLELDVVDSYAVSVRLTLAVLGFAKVFRSVLTRESLMRRVDAVEKLANQRLTAALTGLQRSFSVRVLDSESEHEQALLGMVNQSRAPTRHTRQRLLDDLVDIRAVLRDSLVDLPGADGLDNPYKLFECGWSWGVVRDAPVVKIDFADITQRMGVAVNAPNLYSTAIALDGIQDLWSDRTRLLGLLDDEQQRLASALQLRWDITQLYWSRIARFGKGRWPLEDVPWRSTDGVQSDYLSLLVCSIVIQDLRRRSDPEAASRVARVLSELAERARITRRSAPGEAVTLHSPGFPLSLNGSEDVGGPPLVWNLFDFAPQVLKQAVLVGGISLDITGRRAALDLVDEVWVRHIVRRRLESGLWDQPAAIFPQLEWADADPFWSFTERVVGALVSAAQLAQSPPLRSVGLVVSANDLLAEADHLYDQELMGLSGAVGPAMHSTLNAIGAALDRAHEVLDDLPGTAFMLASSALRDLDALRAARQNLRWNA
jgi:hypothetical protein